MRRIPLVAARSALHDSVPEPRPDRETPADRIAMVTAIVRAHHGWDGEEDRPELERVVRIMTRVMSQSNRTERYEPLHDK